MYVLVREDLTFSQQCVQAAHAALEAGRLYQPLSPPHLVICGVPSVVALQRELAKLTARGVRCCPFYEPDLRGELTAFASEPIAGDHRKAFRSYRLLDGHFSRRV